MSVGKLYNPVYLADDVVAISGIYESIHPEACSAPRQHAFVSGRLFPRCRNCSGSVQYHLLHAEPTQSAKQYAPDEAVKISGIYESLHAKGCRAQQLHAFVLGNVFPRCRQCYGAARYRLLQAAPSPAEIPDFASSLQESNPKPARAAQARMTAPAIMAPRAREAK